MTTDQPTITQPISVRVIKPSERRPARDADPSDCASSCNEAKLSLFACIQSESYTTACQASARVTSSSWAVLASPLWGVSGVQRSPKRGVVVTVKKLLVICSFDIEPTYIITNFSSHVSIYTRKKFHLGEGRPLTGGRVPWLLP